MGQGKAVTGMEHAGHWPQALRQVGVHNSLRICPSYRDGAGSFTLPVPYPVETPPERKPPQEKKPGDA